MYLAADNVSAQHEVRSRVFDPLPEKHTKTSIDNINDSIPPFFLLCDERVPPLSMGDAALACSLYLSLNRFAYNRLDLAIEHLRNGRLVSPQNGIRRDELHLLEALELLSRSPLTDDDVWLAITNLEAIDDSAFVLNEGLRADYYFWRAESARMIGRSVIADEYYNKTIPFASPQLASLAYLRIAELHERKGAYNDALKAYDSASALRSPFALSASLRRASLLGILSRQSDAIAETERAETIIKQSKSIITPYKRFIYESQTEKYLRTPGNNSLRIIGTHSDVNIDTPMLPQIASPLVREQIVLIRAAAMSKSGLYSEIIEMVSSAIHTVESKKDTNISAAERTQLLDGLRFERAWANLMRDSNDLAANEFLELSHRQSNAPKNIAYFVHTLRESGRYADGLYEEFDERSTIHNSSASNKLDYTTSPFYYSNYPARARFYAGIALSRAGRTSEARSLLTDLAQNVSALYSDKARYHLALVEARSSRSFQTEALLEPLGMRRTPSGIYASLLLGDAHYQRSSYVRAAQYFQFVIENAPDTDTSVRATAHLERGLSLIPLGSWSEAVNDLEKYFELTPNDDADTRQEALFWLGRGYLLLDSVASASKCFQELIHVYPKSERYIDAQYCYAWTLFRSARYTESDAAFQKVLEMDSISRYAYDVLSRRGDALYAGGEIRKALTIYNLAVDRPTFNKYLVTRAMFQLGLARMRSDSARSAMNAFNHIITKYPASDILDRSYYNYALAAYAILQTTKAEEAVATLAEKFSESAYTPKALLVSATEAERNENSTLALKRYNQIVSNYPDAAEFSYALFRSLDLLASKKKYTAAIALCDSHIIRSSIAAPREHIPPLVLRRGELLFESGNYTEAMKAFENFSSSFPTHSLYSVSEFCKGKTLVASAKSDDGFRQYESVIEKYHASDGASMAKLELARREKQAGHFDSASALYRSAFALEHYSSDAAPTAMMEYGDMLAKQMDSPDSAIPVFDELTRRYLIETRIGASAQLAISDILLEQGKTSPAIDRMEKAAAAHRGSEFGVRTMLEIAALYRKNGSSKKALSIYGDARTDAGRSQEQYGLASIGYAEMLIATGNKPKARTLLMQLDSDRSISRIYRDRAANLLAKITPKKKTKGGKKK